MEPNKAVEKIRELPFFSRLSDEELEFISHRIEFELFEPGEIIFEEHSEGNKFYVIMQGKVRISKSVNDRPKTLAILNKNDYFGEIALIDKSPRSATAAAIEPVTALSITDDAFLKLMEEDGKSAAKILRELLLGFCKRMRNTNEHLKDLLAWTIANQQ